MKNKEIFASRLKTLRLEHGLLIKEVADIAGLTDSAYGNVESGRKGISVEALERIADYYNVSIDYLLGRSDKIR